MEIKQKIADNNKPTCRSQVDEETSKIETELVDSHAREAQREENKAGQAIKENSKFFFNYARNKSNVKKGNWKRMGRQ